MRIDRENMFSTAQALTSGATTTLASTDIWDQGPLATGNLYRQLGASQLYLVTVIETTATSTGSATFSAKLVSDSASSFPNTALVVSQTPTAIAVASVTAGMTLVTPLPRDVNFERFMRMEYTMGTAPFSAGGAVTSFLTNEPGYWYAYNKNNKESNTF